MENMELGLQLMAVGMVTVFVIILIVIFGSRLLISMINKIAPEEHKAVKAEMSSDGTDAVRPVLEAAVAKLTGGRGYITRITKI